MLRNKTFAIIGAMTCVLAAAAPAKAADPSMIIGAAPEVFKRVPAVMEEFGSGWYLRGDIGFRRTDLDGVATTNGGTGPRSGEFDDAFSIGGGVGMKYSWFRADLTADYLSKTAFVGTTLTSGDTRTSLEGVVVLANLYFDLGTWSGFTPYVGAGVGASNMWTKGLTSPTMPPNTNMSTGTKWDMAWAVMAGISYQVSPRMIVDGGYRYLNLGDAWTGNDAAANQIQFKDMTAHELRLGVRYLID